jgi:hypothetical protein
MNEQVTLHNKELCDLYMSPSIARTVEARRFRWASMGIQGMHAKFNRGTSWEVFLSKI